MRGILRSVMTIDGVHCVALSNPSAPSRAVSTRNPQEDTSSASPDRSFSSSSTINIFSWLICLLVPFSLAYYPPTNYEYPITIRPVSIRISTIRGHLPPGKVWVGMHGSPHRKFQFETKLPL